MPPRSASDKRIRSSSGRALGSIGSMSRRSKSRECRRMRTSATWHLLDENEQLLIQIASNLELFKIQENMDPFLCTSNNIGMCYQSYLPNLLVGKIFVPGNVRARASSDLMNMATM
ncbi:hypothetical protein ACMD2_01826 [Ananas comosus]|uniref:Uncharacterized protein n=1 Tax=Ananas comosus TaxID=4615 RepID=A0A199VWM1_ANACO|nr:hypothetical protein ACMD2_01826 [Ananas comosus]